MRSVKLKKRDSERGSVLAVSAIGMLSFFLAVGLAIDVSHLYTAKAELQYAADASALAAASQLNSTRGGIKQAVTAATNTFNKYDVNKNVTITAANVTFSNNLNGTYVDKASAEANAAQMRFVKVSISPQPVNVTFASLAIESTQNLSASATAGLSVGLSMNKYHAAFLFIEPNATPLAKNAVHVLSAKAWNVNTAPSYRILQGPGGDTVMTGTIHSYAYPVMDWTAQALSEADDCRYAKIGVNARFGDYTTHPGVNASNAPPDTLTRETINYQQYRDLQGDGVKDRADGMEDRRIIILPIAKSSAYNTSSRVAQSNRLGAFFIKKKMTAACTLEVEYIGVPMSVPNGTYTPGSTQAGELSIAVLYK